ncbi:MAG: magnesium transporter [Verrucomicrobiota bacterium]
MRRSRKPVLELVSNGALVLQRRKRTPGVMSESEDTSEKQRPWKELHERIELSDAAGAAEALADLSLDDQRLTMAHLSGEDQAILIESLLPEEAAEVLEHLPEAQAADILEDLPSESAADIVEALPEMLGAELLREMHESESEALLSRIDDPEEAEQLRERSGFAWDTAGGLMSVSFASFPEAATVGDVLEELGEKAEAYADMDVQYVYIVNEADALRGVLRLRDLVLTRRGLPVSEVMIADPAYVEVDDDFESLRKQFDERNFLGLPVVDPDGKLAGVVTQDAVREATADHQTEDYLRSSGILGGEELRSMSMLARCGRRLAWLGPNIILNVIAASVIAMYEDTLEAVIALAVFLPIVSDMSGCSGNQAVAVSIRELTLGLIRPNEFRRIVWKEGILGMTNGFVLGCLLGSLAALWKDNLYLGLVVGGALFLNTILSVLLGGSVPLLLKRLKIDPALASGPILTTCTDMCGFFLVLNLASVMLEKLVY